MPSTYEKIATTTLGSSSASISFTSISGAYTDLVIESQFFATSATGLDIYFRFNNDSATNYSYTALEGQSTGVGSNRTTNQTATYLDPVHYLTPTNTNQPIQSKIQINNYSNSTTYKTALSRNGLTIDQVTAIAHLWRNTAAINRIDFTMVNANFAAGSTISIYGIKAA